MKKITLTLLSFIGSHFILLGQNATEILTQSAPQQAPLLQLNTEKNSKQKLNTILKNEHSFNKKDTLENNSENILEETIQNPVKPISKSKIFGFDFFQNPKISFTPNLNMPTPANYILATGDEILVEIWGAAQNSIKQKIDNQGNISVDIVGKIHIGGLPFEQAKERVRTALQRVYSGISAPDGSFMKINVNLSVVNIRTIKVNIIGEVEAPGSYALNGLSTLLNALYACGGPSEKGSFRQVQLIRNGKKIADFDVYQFLLTGSQDGNISLQEQDVILVPPYLSHIEVAGKVKREGIFELKPGETLADLTRFFGGFDANAYRDNLIIERITGAKREVKEIPYGIASSFTMKDGDLLTVHELSKIYHNKLSIGGAVYQPGNYAFTQGMTLLQLIERAAGIIQESAYQERGIIFRGEGVNSFVLNFSLADILNKKQEILLQPNDSIHIFDVNSIKNSYAISVKGAVKNALKIPFREGITVEDLILMAGGFREGADPKTIQIGRQINDKNFKTISKIFEIQVANNLIPSEKSIELLPNDIVTVRFQKGYTEQKTISVRGEVAIPGDYIIENRDEKISSILKRAGGLTPYANIKGVILVRKKNDPLEQELLRRLANSDNEIQLLEETKNEYRIGINLERILKNEKNYENLIVKEGDILHFSSEKETVEVVGEVHSPSMIRFEKGMSLASYINHSGGFSNKAKRNAIFVKYANGDIKATRKFLFFRSYPKVEAGATIVVPERPEQQPISFTEGLGIISQMTTLGLLIYNIFK